MTTERNVDRIVEAWLDLMPSEAPDRVVSAVLDIVATEPQRRAWAPALRRSPFMTRLIMVATVIALAVAGIGGALLIGARSTTPVPTSQPTATSHATPTAEGGAIPDPYIVRWIGAPRDLPDLGTTLDTQLAFDQTTIAFSGSGYIGRHFVSTAEIRGDTLEVTTADQSTSGPGTCASGAVGHYTIALGPIGSRLSLESVDDACDARAVAFSGEWYRVACKADTTCFGDLDAGSYPTVNFGPLQDPALPAARDFGQLAYTVPEGWAIAGDYITDIRLVRSSDYALETGQGPPDGNSDAIEAWIRPAALSVESCDGQLDSDVERTADGLVEWVARHPALDAGQPGDITIDGRAARMIDISIAPTWSETCGFPRPVAMLLGEAVGVAGPVGDDPYVVGIMSPARMRLIFLDLGSERVVAILIRSVDPARFDTFVAEAMPIVETFEFN